MRYLFTIAFFLMAYSAGYAQPITPQLGKASVKEVVAAMTMEDKVKLLVGMGFIVRAAPSPEVKTEAEKRASDSLEKEFHKRSSMDPADEAIPEKVPGAAGRTHAIARLGIPGIIVSDGPAGVRINPYRNNNFSHSYFATAFPVGTLLASSWDTSLVQKVGTALGSEIRDYGIDMLLGPGMNIQRNPLGGRNFEYYSEDPLLSGRIAAAMVRGIQSNGVGATIKHFAANNGESNRTQMNTIISERALREIYFKNFEIAVKESAPWAVMSSYNKINGIYTSESAELLTTLLRDEWGYNGLVMSDWGGGKNPAAQVNAGNDLLMPGNTKQSKAISGAVDSGTVDVKTLDRNVEKILNIILLSPSFKKYQASDNPDLKSDAAIARLAAAESMVLLKNENTLPFTGNKKIALFGNASYNLISGGSGSGDVNKAYKISLNQGLGNAGFIINEKLSEVYESYIKNQNLTWPKPKNFLDHVPPVPDMKCEKDMIEKASGENDLAIYTIGRNSGEGVDRAVENDFDLTDNEKTMLKEISEAFHKKGKKLIVVLNIGGVVETASWRNESDAILLAWQPGLEGGNAITDILSGKQNPGGKLAISFPLKYDDVPSARYFPGRETNPSANVKTRGDQPAEIIYGDGIYVGYRYYQSFHVKTAYPFGYGLSYTSFSYTNLNLSSPSFVDNMVVGITVTNTGKVTGKEVVELYLTAPAAKINKPEEELKGFAKTHLLNPGESQNIQITLNLSSLSSFDTYLTAWVAEEGTYKVKIGGSAEDIRLEKNFNLDSDIELQKLKKVLAPAVEIKEMKP